MATFLQLVKDTEQESGTMPSLIQTVTGATGRHGLFVSWVRNAWKLLQAERTSWAWQRKSWQHELIVGVQAYDAPALGITGPFKSWVFDTESGNDVTIYDPDVGQDQEGFLNPSDWLTFRKVYMVGSNVSRTGKPYHVARGEDQRLYFWPTPDKPYIVRGEYVKGSQVLTNDSDIPECPTEYHDVIKYQALLLMSIYDESPLQHPLWSQELARLKSAMMSSQLPRVRLGDPLA